MTDLTDDFKNLKLKEGQKYICKTPTGIDVFEFGICRDDLNNIWCYLENQRYCYNNVYHSDEIEVLAPCDYEELQQLRQLLKECKDIIEWYKADTGYVDLPTENILTRINAAIGKVRSDDRIRKRRRCL